MKLGSVGINFSISKSRAIAIVAIVALLLISTQLWDGTKEDRNTHYLRSVGSCNQPTIIKIYDETGGVEPVISQVYEEDRSVMSYFKSEKLRSVMLYSTEPVNTIENKYFKKYINTISRYIFSKVEVISQCKGTDRLPKVELTFVYRPAISRGVVPFNNLTPRKSKHQDKQLDSPWVKLTLNRSPQLNFKATFIWNERQFLLDQALVLGEQIWDDNPPMPIALETFNRWQADYFKASASKQEDSFTKQLPADMRWLFINASISDCSRWSEVRCGLKEIMDEYDKLGYADLSIALIDRLFGESKTQLRYENILDLKEIFNIKKYKIYPFIQ